MKRSTALLITALVALFWCVAALSRAQILLPESIERDAFFTVEARLDPGDDPGIIEYTLLWDYPPGFVEGRQIVRQCDGEKLLMVGPPGVHRLGLFAVGQRYVEQLVLMPDPDNPTDVTLAKPTTIRVPAGRPIVERYTAEFTIGDPPPDDDEGDDQDDDEVDPPGPDPWGIAATVRAVAAALGPEVKRNAKATAALFQRAADGMETGDFPSTGSAVQWLKVEREQLWGATAASWNPVVEAWNEVYAPLAPMDKPTLIAFYRAIAAGLRGVS